MEQKESLSPQYVTGFNQGYILAKEIPTFTIQDIEKMPKSIQVKPRIQGMKDGMKQFAKEQYLSKVKSNIPKPTQQKSPNKSIRKD